MKKAETSLFVFGLYMILIVGTGFMVMPSVVLGTFNLSFGDDTWIRFVGMMAAIVGVYYIVAARYHLKELYGWTVIMRFFAAVFMLLMVLIGKVETSVIGFAIIEVAGASWTWMTTQQKTSRVPS